MGCLHTLATDSTELAREAWAIARARCWWLLGALVALIGVTLLLVSRDDAWLALVTRSPRPFLEKLADGLTYWGNYQTGSLFVGGLLLLVGALGRSTRLRRAALASLLAASLGGATANLARSLIGRPRPMAEMPDGLYGPSLRFKMQGSPSGHAATSFATATALVVAAPLIGAPVVVAALAVGWSRLYLRHHHPTDVLLGGGLGVMAGGIFGLAARRTTRDSKRRSKVPPEPTPAT